MSRPDDREVSASFFLKAARLVALGFGAGLSPKAPGTAGSVVGLLLGAWLLHRSTVALGAGTLLATFIGLWAIRVATGQPWRGTKTAHDDPGWIVIDEVAGQMLALLALPRVAWPGLLAAFGLFRLFDIAKPGPIGWADRQGGSLGIMGDDLLAGGAAALVLLAARTLFNLGG